MKKLKQFNLRQLNDVFRSTGDGQELDDHVSENLIIVRNPPIKRLLSQLSGQTYVMPEMRVVVMTRGWAEPTINLMPRRFEAGQVFFLSHNSIIEMGQYADDVQGFGLSISDELLSLTFRQAMPRMFDGRVRDFSFALAPEEMGQLEALHSLLYRMKENRQHASQVMLHLVAAFLWQVDYYWSRYEDEYRATHSREQQIFSDFVQLVSQYAAQEHNIDFYAQRLFLSPRYMSTLLRKVSGKAAKQWIDEAITTRVKVSLRHSDKTIAQIAAENNFPNPAFFCKFFKRMTGLTPLDYREGGNDKRSKKS